MFKCSKLAKGDNFMYTIYISFGVKKNQHFCRNGSLEEDFFKTHTVFSLFRGYRPFEKGETLYLNKLDSPFVPSLVEFAQGFLKRSPKCEKSTDGQTDGRIDGRRTKGDLRFR